MSWNYSGNPNESKKDEIRFLVGDTNENEPILQDEEIQYLIDEYASNEKVLFYQVFSRVATLFSRDVSKKLGPQSEDTSGRLKYYQQQAEYYRSTLVNAGLSTPKYNHPKAFHRGMHGNPPWPRGAAQRGDNLV